MARNRVVRRSFSKAPGRLTEWISVAYQTDATTLAASSFVVAAVMGPLGLAKRPFTITRTVGMLAIYGDQAGAIEHPLVALGGIVVSDKAVATGATAIPDPVTEVESDSWFLYATLAGPQATSLDGPPPSIMQFDSRAQRKVADGDQVVFVISNPNAVDGLRFYFQFRQLVKLS